MAKAEIMKSILIIEDDITYGMMLKTWLGKKGFEVSSESNIARAKKHIDTEMPDLILSDLRLPDQDGIHLLSWMNERGMDIPLIIMTGYADIQTAVQAIKLGARDYIAKPVNPEELLKKISEALQNKEGHAAVPSKPSSNKMTPSPLKVSTIITFTITFIILFILILTRIITIANPNSIPAKLREEHPDVVLLDMNFSSGINSGNEGLYWLDRKSVV